MDEEKKIEEQVVPFTEKRKSSLLQWEFPKQGAGTQGINATELVVPGNAAVESAPKADNAITEIVSPTNAANPVKSTAVNDGDVNTQQGNVTDNQPSATENTSQGDAASNTDVDTADDGEGGRVKRDVPIARRPTLTAEERAKNRQRNNNTTVEQAQGDVPPNDDTEVPNPNGNWSEQNSEGNEAATKSQQGEPVKENGGQSDDGYYDPEDELYAQYLGTHLLDNYKKISDDEYDALKAKENSGEPLTKEERRQIFIKEYRPGEPPAPPKYEQYKVLEMPPAANFTKNYDNAYALMQERLRTAGDDPATKARRAKARRAAKIIAMISDILQASINMWGAYKGAKSGKLTSASATLKAQEQKEEALAMKRAAQYTKDLEAARRADRDMNRILDSRMIAEWKALNDSRKELAKDRNASKKTQYRYGLMEYKSLVDAFLRGLNGTATAADKEALEKMRHRNALERQNNASARRKEENAQKHQYKVVEKQTKSAAQIAKEKQEQDLM